MKSIDRTNEQLAYILGRIIKKARKKKKIRQVKLAKRLQVDQSYISKVELGVYVFDMLRIKIIGRELKIRSQIERIMRMAEKRYFYYTNQG